MIENTLMVVGIANALGLPPGGKITQWFRFSFLFKQTPQTTKLVESTNTTSSTDTKPHLFLHHQVINATTHTLSAQPPIAAASIRSHPQYAAHSQQVNVSSAQ